MQCAEFFKQFLFCTSLSVYISMDRRHDKMCNGGGIWVVVLVDRQVVDWVGGSEHVETSEGTK